MEVDDPVCYGDDATYVRAIEFLDGIGTLEDWGCGSCYARRYVKKARYVGIESDPSKFNFITADLSRYSSKAEYILLKHVLCDNPDWQLIVQNAVKSFKKRMCIVVETAIISPPLASKVDLRDKMPPIVDQEGLGSSAACAVTSSFTMATHQLNAINLISLFDCMFSKEVVGTDTLFCLQRP